MEDSRLPVTVTNKIKNDQHSIFSVFLLFFNNVNMYMQLCACFDTHFYWSFYVFWFCHNPPLTDWYPRVFVFVFVCAHLPTILDQSYFSLSLSHSRTCTIKPIETLTHRWWCPVLIVCWIYINQNQRDQCSSSRIWRKRWKSIMSMEVPDRYLKKELPRLEVGHTRCSNLERRISLPSLCSLRSEKWYVVAVSVAADIADLQTACHLLSYSTRWSQAASDKCE